MRSLTKAFWFALTCGVVAFLLSFITQPGDLRRNVISGVIGLVVGFLLMMALRSRP